jgi:hypothetical protein
VKTRTELGALVATGALVAAAAWIRLRALQVSPYPTGVDGYWYLIQVRSLLEQGRLYYPSAPLVPCLMAGLSLIFDPVLAVKVIAALGTAALIVPAYVIARRISGAAGPALLGAALTATSAQSFFLCTEFVKQGVGLSLAMGFVASLAALLERPGKSRAALAAGAFLLCLLAHKTALGLALVMAGPPVAVRLWRSRRQVAVWVGLAIGGVGSLALAWAARDEMAPLRHLFRSSADFSFAVLSAPGRVSLILGHEVALVAALAVVALGLAWLRKPVEGPRLPWLAIGFVAFAIFQGLPWLDVADDQGLGYRLRLCACVCLAPCSALVASQLVGWARPRMRTALLALTIGLVLMLRPWSSDEGVIKAHPAMVEATARLAGVLPPDATVVIPERHTAFMAAWYGRVDVRLRPPPIIVPGRTFRLLPGAAIRPGLWAALDELRAHPVVGVAPALALHALHPSGLVLLAEPTFQYLVAQLPAAERRWYAAWVVQ